MEQEPRKATDVLLALESKVEMLLGVVRSQDLKIGIISNKLNAATDLIKTVMSMLAKPQDIPKFSVEAVSNDMSFPSYEESEKKVPISAEYKLPQEDNPKGFRRTSRPESYAGDNAVLPKPKPKSPQQSKAEVVVPAHVTAKQAPIENVMPQAPPPTQDGSNKNAIPTMQRVVDRNGKSVFLADVEIIDLTTNQQVFKTRTNGTGKWMASLAPSQYKVLIRKVESLTGERVSTPQDITVDGSKSPLELPMLIIK